MTSKVSSTKSENVKRTKPDVFERLSADKKKGVPFENGPRLQSRRPEVRFVSKANLSKKYNGQSSVVPITSRKLKPDSGRQKNDGLPAANGAPSPIKGKKIKSENVVEKVSDKSLLENIPENVNKDDEEHISSSLFSLFSDSENLDNSQDFVSNGQNKDLNHSVNYFPSSLPRDADSTCSIFSNCEESFVTNEETDEIAADHWTPYTDDHNIPNSPKSDRIQNENNNHLTPSTYSTTSSTTRSLTSKEILKEMKENNLKKVEDQDKDVCDDDKLSEDDEFYKIKVLTRNVSYENSTLVIRNTSKNKDGSETVGSETDGEENVCSNHDSYSMSSSASLHSSSSELTMLEERSELHSNNDADEAVETRPPSSVRNRLGQFVTRGKLILSDVRSSSYMADVKNPINRLQNVTRRSFRSLLARSPVAISSSHENINQRRFSLNSVLGLGEEYSHSGVKLKETDTTDDHKRLTVKTDLATEVFIRDPKETIIYSMSSTESAPIEVVPFHPKSLIGLEGPNELARYSPEQLNTHSAVANIDSQDSPSESSGCSEFFSPCYCSGISNANRIPTNHEIKLMEYCSCKQESELPLEIKEILDCDHARMWWTITGNFGNILPIDWSKTYTRQKYLPVLNLNEAKKLDGAADSLTPSPRINGQDDEDEVAHDLDLHQLILAGTQSDTEPVKSAEEVIKEIDDIMQEGSSSEDEGIDASSPDSSLHQELRKLPPPLYHDKLKELNVNELNETVMELEAVIRQYSETLIAQLAHRDELEYEKELKNTFISLLLQVQNKRRNYNIEKKRIRKPLGPYGTEPKYLTTVIPYDVGHGPPHNQTILMLIKILTAINGDIPTVPTLLTDYILKVLCPSSS